VLVEQEAEHLGDRDEGNAGQQSRDEGPDCRHHALPGPGDQGGESDEHAGDHEHPAQESENRRGDGGPARMTDLPHDTVSDCRPGFLGSNSHTFRDGDRFPMRAGEGR
jgi:hypothetical protein